MPLEYDPRIVIKALENEYKNLLSKKKLTQTDILRGVKIIEKWKQLTNFKNKDDE